MQRERQKGNRDFGNRHIALFLSLVLLILCLVPGCDTLAVGIGAVSYTHLRAHET